MKRINSNDKRAVRQNLFQRFGGRCAYCNARTGLRGGTVDHYVAQSLGGTNARENLRWCCISCNRAKGNMTPEQWEVCRPQPMVDSLSPRCMALVRIAQRARQVGAW